jgi:hemoglobin
MYKFYSLNQQLQSEVHMSEQSLFEQIGGEAAVDAAVDIFYRKVLADDRINQFFEGVDMERQAAKQKAFLTVAFGGPNNYTGKDMRDGHAHLVKKGLNDSHFDAVMENLGATLKELNVPDELIAKAAAIAESTRNDVLGR